MSSPISTELGGETTTMTPVSLSILYLCSAKKLRSNSDPIIKILILLTFSFSIIISSDPSSSTRGNKIDSSVLPGRVHAIKPIQFKSNFLQFSLPNLFKGIRPYIYDFRQAPKEVYNPSRKDICKIGNSKILELPVTKNLSESKKGIPISGGSLEKYGIKNDLRSIKRSGINYPVLVYHPWEFIKVKDKKLVFNEKLFLSLTELLDACKSHYSFKTICLDNIP